MRQKFVATSYAYHSVKLEQLVLLHSVERYCKHFASANTRSLEKIIYCTSLLLLPLLSISSTCLHAAFTLGDPKSEKRHWWFDCLFALLGSACIQKCFEQIFSPYSLALYFLEKEYSQKSWSLILGEIDYRRRQKISTFH